MKITAVTSIKYQDEALEQQYRSRVDKFLQKLLNKVAAGEDAGNTLGVQVETWYPDQSTKVDVNIQPGVTSPIIRVRVMRVEENPKEERKKKKEGTAYIPYLWVGVAAYDYEYEDIHYGDPCCWASVMIHGRLYGFEPIQQGESYSMWHAVESQEGACYPGGWSAYCENVVYDLEEAADGACEPDRWVPLAVSCSSEEIQPGGPGVFGPSCDTLDFSSYGPLRQFSTDYCDSGNIGQYTHAAKRSLNNMYLTGTVGTQLYGPDAAWAGELPKQYWHQSILIDPDGSSVREDSASTSQFFFEYGDGYGILFQDTTILGETLKSKVVPGYYRIDVAAAGFECDPWTAKIRIRMVLGKPGVVPSTDPERIGETDFATQEVVDFYCEGIGSDQNETVINEWYGRLWALGGAHPYDFPQNSNEKDPDGYGPNPGYPENPGFWSQSLYVDVQNGNWHLAAFDKLAPFYGDGKAALFNVCNCVFEDGVSCFGDPNPVTASTHVLYTTGTCDNYTNINGGYAFQLARVVYRCDDHLRVKMVGNLGKCGPCFSEGSCEMAVQMFASEDLRSIEQAQSGQVDLGVGELVMVTALNMWSPKIGVSRIYPSWLGKWWDDLRCPTSAYWESFIRHTQDRGRAAVSRNDSGECVPRPIYWTYNIAGRGFDR